MISIIKAIRHEKTEELKVYGTFFDELCLVMIGFDRGQPPTEKQVS